MRRMYKPNKFTHVETRQLHERIESIINEIEARRKIDTNAINVDVEFDLQGASSTEGDKEKQGSVRVWENLGSLIDYQLTNVIDAINSGKKRQALAMSMSFANGMRKVFNDYRIYMKEHDKKLKSQLKQLQHEVNTIDEHLYHVELASQQSIQRTVKEVRERMALESKLKVYSGSVSADADSWKQYSGDYIDIFQQNLNAMRDKFNNVERIIEVQKQQQNKRIQCLLQKNRNLQRQLNPGSKHDIDALVARVQSKIKIANSENARMDRSVGMSGYS
eukprot:g6219.t1